MKNKLISKLLISTLALSMIFSGCGNTESRGDNNTEVTADDNSKVKKLKQTMDDDEIEDGLMDFSINLFKESVNADENSLVSPISVIYALDMLSAGANGDTQDEILEILCPGATMDDLVKYSEGFYEKFDNKGKTKFYLANSAWANEERIGNELKQEYVALIDKYLDAKTELIPFDEEGLDIINGWVDKTTKGRIPTILDEIPENAVMYLVNAMTFDGVWNEEYMDHQIDENAQFTNSDGKTEAARMLNSVEKYYLETDKATGFIKYYSGEQFAFVAILPTDEDISLDEFVENFDTDDYKKLMKTKTDDYDVRVGIPCFKYDYSITMNDALQNLGITAAFDEDEADFTPMAVSKNGNIYVKNVFHKTYIELNEEGTKAAAVTAIEMTDKAMVMVDEERYVYLDRPFVYAIIDADTKLPVMMGTVNSVK